MEEAFSIVEDRMKQDPELEKRVDELGGLTNNLKELVAEVLEDLEISRWDFARALVKFSEMEEPMVIHTHTKKNQFESESDDELDQETHISPKPTNQNIRPSIKLMSNKPHFES